MLQPLVFEPIFKSMLWGGTRLPQLLGRHLEHADPIGEAWLLSDVDGSLSTIASGPFAGRTFRSLLAEHADEIFGKHKPSDGRFPLLLKLIDAKQALSVQVHPNDQQAVELAGVNQRGKTEAWHILDANPQTSLIYAGFRQGVSASQFRDALATGSAAEMLHQFTPQIEDTVFLRAGTVHAIGADIMLFEVQQTSDITYRLYDWDRRDAKTGLPRPLHIDAGLKCSDFEKGPCQPIPVQDDDCQSLVACEYFGLDRVLLRQATCLERRGQCQVIVVTQGQGRLTARDTSVQLQFGTTVLLPASLNDVHIYPQGNVLKCLVCTVVAE